MVDMARRLVEGPGNRAGTKGCPDCGGTCQVRTGANPDSILFEPVHGEVYTFNGKGKSATVFDPESGKVIATIDLGGKPEFGVTNGAGRLYVNIEDKGEVAELDPRRMRVVRRWSLAPCQEPTGLAIDRAHNLPLRRGHHLHLPARPARAPPRTPPRRQGRGGCPAVHPGHPT